MTWKKRIKKEIKYGEKEDAKTEVPRKYKKVVHFHPMYNSLSYTVWCDGAIGMGCGETIMTWYKAFWYALAGVGGAAIVGGAIVAAVVVVLDNFGAFGLLGLLLLFAVAVTTVVLRYDSGGW